MYRNLEIVFDLIILNKMSDSYLIVDLFISLKSVFVIQNCFLHFCCKYFNVVEYPQVQQKAFKIFP